jgi:hypothetical protein
LQREDDDCRQADGGESDAARPARGTQVKGTQIHGRPQAEGNGEFEQRCWESDVDYLAIAKRRPIAKAAALAAKAKWRNAN